MSDADSPVIAAKAPSMTRWTALASLAPWRRTVQAAMIAVLGQWSFYGIFRCPFIVPYISCRNCPILTCEGRLVSLFWGFWFLLPISAVLFGRAFCGWACPGGLVNQLLGKIAPVKLRVRNSLTRFSPLGGTLSVFSAAMVFFLLQQPRANVPIRTGEFFSSVVLTFEHSGTFWLIRSIILVGFLVGGLLVANLWCRFACPTGSLLEVFRPVSVMKFYKTSRCNDCNQCLQVCEMGTRPAEAGCTNCGDCLGSCPVNAIRFGRKKSL